MTIQYCLPIEPRDDVADLLEELERLEYQIRGTCLDIEYCRMIIEKLNCMRRTVEAAGMIADN